MPRPSLAGCLASNLETHVECVPRPRQWGGFRATKPAKMPLFYSGADTDAKDSSGQVFLGPGGKRMDPDYFDEFIFGRVSAQAGLPNVRFS